MGHPEKPRVAKTSNPSVRDIFFFVENRTRGSTEGETHLHSLDGLTERASPVKRVKELDSKLLLDYSAEIQADRASSVQLFI